MSLKESAPANRTTPKKSPRSQKPIDKSRPDLNPGPDLPEEQKVIKVRRLRDNLAVAQVVSATNVPHGFDPLGDWIGPSSAALYQDFQAEDPVDSILARLMVGISGMSMDALSRGMRTDLFDVRELELKKATKGALVAAELAKVYDARRDRGKQTVNVGQEVAQRFVEATIKDLAAQGHLDRLSEKLPLQLKHLRHVRIMVMDNFGNLTELSRPPDTLSDEQTSRWAPTWFTALVAPNLPHRQVRVVSVPHVQPVVIAGEPADEIAETWHDFYTQALVWLGLNGLVLTMLFVVLDRSRRGCIGKAPAICSRRHLETVPAIGSLASFPSSSPNLDLAGDGVPTSSWSARAMNAATSVSSQAATPIGFLSLGKRQTRPGDWDSL
jgi:hypothetical protein